VASFFNTTSKGPLKLQQQPRLTIGLVNLAQTWARQGSRFPCITIYTERVMAFLNKDKHKEYVRFAGHCLEMVTVTRDRDTRSIQREMAAEWLHLAEEILRKSKKSGRGPQATEAIFPSTSGHRKPQDHLER
jgi:hypothetical protein